jgi:KUP system potassium uptake protein
MAKAEAEAPQGDRPQQDSAALPDAAAKQEAPHVGGHGAFLPLLIGSIGVVFGDIGTSPLYAFREALVHFTHDGGAIEPVEVLGVVSLIFWALLIVVTAKYVVLLMRMDNRGEGGTLSLMSLATRAIGRRTGLLFVFGIVGASLFYGDALITPAISVLSAVEGLKQVDGLSKDVVDPLVLPLGAAILVSIFMVQSRGTGVVGRLFGPITVFWFLAMAVLGLGQILQAGSLQLLLALSPLPGLQLLFTHGWLAFFVLGSVFLAVTGAEALYADMGHFGRRPIRVGWIGLVLPCLMLNYLGQAAYVLEDLPAINAQFAGLAEGEEADFSPFFRLAPDVLRLPLVILATFATIIASQAVISGAFSLTQQAVQLGLLPRMEIRRTSETQAGQIYIPQVNWLLLVGVLALALGFGSAGRLAAAYGIAITGDMIVSSLLAFFVIWKVWKRPLWVAALTFAPFLLVELVFLSSNLTRVLDGGYVPIILAIGLITVMWTWTRGSRLLLETTRRETPIARLFETLAVHPPRRVSGTAIFLTSDLETAPAALLHNLKHNQVLHEQIVLLTVKTAEQPRVPDAERIKIEDYLPDVKRVTMTFGFMETPNVPKVLSQARKLGLKLDTTKTSFFLSRRTVMPSEKSGMPLWQDHLFIFLARNAINATDFFHIPSGRAVELGNQVTV